MKITMIAAVLLHSLFAATTVWGQLGGSFAGGFDSGSNDYAFGGVWRFDDESQWQSSEHGDDWITIQGVAEIRVPAEEIGVVLAVTSDGETAEECQELIATQIAAVREAWQPLNIADEKTFEDFIAVLPRYEWHEERRDGEDVRIQKLAGYRMQVNLHVSVANEAEAKAAINGAFREGVTDIITFNYWSSKLNEEKERVLAMALAAAKKKADMLLTVFDEQPPVINVEEKSGVFFPTTLYRTYENVLEEQDLSYRRDDSKPRIKAYRPKTTFFQGLQAEADNRPEQLPLRPEIAVVATVRIYYRSPGHERGDKDGPG